jgi:hypothetical protein
MRTRDNLDGLELLRMPRIQSLIVHLVLAAAPRCFSSVGQTSEAVDVRCVQSSLVRAWFPRKSYVDKHYAMMVEDSNPLLWRIGIKIQNLRRDAK